MRHPAVVLVVVLASASMWAQALMEYHGALAPAARLAARPPSPATRIHRKQVTSIESLPAHASAQSRRPQTEVESPRAKNGSFVREIHLSEQQKRTEATRTEPKNGSIAAPDGITIQR